MLKRTLGSPESTIGQVKGGVELARQECRQYRNKREKYYMNKHARMGYVRKKKGCDDIVLRKCYV